MRMAPRRATRPPTLPAIPRGPHVHDYSAVSSDSEPNSSHAILDRRHLCHPPPAYLPLATASEIDLSSPNLLPGDGRPRGWPMRRACTVATPWTARSGGGGCGKSTSPCRARASSSRAVVGALVGAPVGAWRGCWTVTSRTAREDAGGAARFSASGGEKSRRRRCFGAASVGVATALVATEGAARGGAADGWEARGRGLAVPSAAIWLAMTAAAALAAAARRPATPSGELPVMATVRWDLLSSASALTRGLVPRLLPAFPRSRPACEPAAAAAAAASGGWAGTRGGAAPRASPGELAGGGGAYRSSAFSARRYGGQTAGPAAEEVGGAAAGGAARFGCTDGGPEEGREAGDGLSGVARDAALDADDGSEEREV